MQYYSMRKSVLLAGNIVTILAMVTFSGCVDYPSLDRLQAQRESSNEAATEADGWDGESATQDSFDGDNDFEPSDALDGGEQGIPDGHAVCADATGGVHERPPSCIDSYGFYRFQTDCFNVPNPEFIHMNLDYGCFVFFWLDKYSYEDSCTGTITDHDHLSLECARIGGVCTGQVDLHAPFSLNCNDFCTINMEWLGSDFCESH